MRAPFMLFSLLLFLFFAAPALADEAVLVKLGYQMLEPSGKFAGFKNGLGTEVDLEKGMDFDSSTNLTAEVALQYGDFRLSAGYLPIQIKGAGTNLDFDFNDIRFNGAVAGRIDADIYDLAICYYLINMDDLPSRFQLGLEVSTKIVAADMQVTEAVTGLTESVSDTLPIPTVGGRVRVALSDFIGLVGRAGYMAYSGNSFLDAEAQLEFSPLPLVGVYAGYRYFDINVDESDILLDAQFKGPFAGAFVRF